MKGLLLPILFCTLFPHEIAAFQNSYRRGGLSLHNKRIMRRHALFSSAVLLETDKLRPREESKDGAITMDVDELSKLMGGKGRARLVWDYYRIGVDPLRYFRSEERAAAGSTNSLDSFLQSMEASDEEILKLLPTSRKTQSLGKEALEKLSSLYDDFGGMLEGGVATISHISKASDGTTKLLIELCDGLEVETVIIPWFDKGWSTICIS